MTSSNPVLSDRQSLMWYDWTRLVMSLQMTSNYALVVLSVWPRQKNDTTLNPTAFCRYLWDSTLFWSRHFITITKSAISQISNTVHIRSFCSFDNTQTLIPCCCLQSSGLLQLIIHRGPPVINLPPPTFKNTAAMGFLQEVQSMSTGCPFSPHFPGYPWFLEFILKFVLFWNPWMALCRPTKQNSSSLSLRLHSVLVLTSGLITKFSSQRTQRKCFLDLLQFHNESNLFSLFSVSILWLAVFSFYDCEALCTPVFWKVLYNKHYYYYHNCYANIWHHDWFAAQRSGICCNCTR